MTKIVDIINQIVEEFKRNKHVEAIALAGSLGASSSDEMSDYDIYIYSNEPVDIEFRQQIAKKFSDKFEVNNQYFETGDEWILRDSSKVVDIMYRKPSDIEGNINWVWKNHNACVGYTTCFVFNVKNSIIFYDKNNWYKSLQDSVSGDYPKELQQNIIAKNLPLLNFKLVASFVEQVEKAIKREDLISVNHRLSAFLASYFDVLFAKNKILHCGEKRLKNYALNNCKLLPKNFENDINDLFTKENKVTILKSLANNLKEII